jgi:hypothetical protein
MCVCVCVCVCVRICVCVSVDMCPSDVAERSKGRPRAQVIARGNSLKRKEGWSNQREVGEERRSVSVVS